MHQDDLILGVDGGGSKTVAWLARRDELSGAHAIGRGRSGPSNVRSISVAQATANLERAIESAFDDANLAKVTVSSACLSLAGADRSVEQKQIRSWADQSNVADQLTITNDAISVLYAASRHGVGIALISGTGSLAIGRNAQGETARCGGWGGLFGDEGSGYQISLCGLRAAARAADGRGPQTTVLQSILDHFQITNASELIPVVYSAKTERATIARLAPVVFQAAESGDEVARAIVDCAATGLNEMVLTLAARLAMAGNPFSLGITGGVLLHQPKFVEKVRRQLMQSGLERAKLTPVHDPVAGAIVIALEK